MIYLVSWTVVFLLVLILPVLALIFSVLNAAVLIIRIRAEARALGERTTRTAS